MFIKYIIELVLLASYFMVCSGAPDCILQIPPFPLTQAGLTTPYQLGSVNPATPCTMKDITAGASFVEATIFDPDTNKLFVYHPLVVTAGTQPLVPPTQFVLPTNAIVGIWFGTNANTIMLTPLTSITQGLCVNGIGQTDIFGQFAHCNGIAFFEAVNKVIKLGIQLDPPIPPLGVGNDGLPCPTTRDYFIVDMDPSDNVITTYLVDPLTGLVAQDTRINRQTNPNASNNVAKNGSDNRLLVVLNALLQCFPYQVPNLTDPERQTKIASLALNEIHAGYHQQPPWAFIPKGDPMVRAKAGGPSLVKLNEYRKGVNQPVVSNVNQAPTLQFCAHYVNIQLPRLQKNKNLFGNQLSPDANLPNLFVFLANRFFQSYMGLQCNILLDIPDPITLIMTNNVITDAVIQFVEPVVISPVDPYNPEPTPPPTAQPTLGPTVNPTLTPSPTVPPTSNPTLNPTNTNNVNPGPGLLIMEITGGVICGVVCMYCVYKYCQTPPRDNVVTYNEQAQPLVTIKTTPIQRLSSPRSPRRQKF